MSINWLMITHIHPLFSLYKFSYITRNIVEDTYSNNLPLVRYKCCGNKFLCPLNLPLNARCLTGRTCNWSNQEWFSRYWWNNWVTGTIYHRLLPSVATHFQLCHLEWPRDRELWREWTNAIQLITFVTHRSPWPKIYPSASFYGAT